MSISSDTVCFWKLVITKANSCGYLGLYIYLLCIKGPAMTKSIFESVLWTVFVYGKDPCQREINSHK